MDEQCGRVRGCKGSEAVRSLRRPVQGSIGGGGSGGGRWVGGGEGWGFSNRAQAYETASLAQAVARALLAMHVTRSNGRATGKQEKRKTREGRGEGETATRGREIRALVVAERVHAARRQGQIGQGAR